MDTRIWRKTHKTPAAEDTPIYDSVHLLTYSIYLRLFANATSACERMGDVHRDCLTHEGPEHYVEGNEDQVEISFPVSRIVCRGCRYVMRDEEERGKRVECAWYDVGRGYLPAHPEGPDHEEQLQ